MSHERFINLNSRLFNTPLLLHPEYAQSISNVMLSRMGAESFDVTPVADFTENGFHVMDDDDDISRQRQETPEHLAFSRAPFRGYASWYMLKRHEGIGILPVRGALTNDGPLGYASLGPSYKSIADDFAEMMSDPAVKGVAMYLHSPGGEVTGVSQALQSMLSNKRKPVWLFVNEHSYSAGYWLSVAADRIFVTPTSGTGSIGVVYTHFNYQEAMKRQGVEATFVHSGANKVLANSYEPLSDRGRVKLQHDSDVLWNQFAGTVADNRPKLTIGEVFDMEANTYIGELGIKAGLADELVQSEAEFLEKFSEHLESSNSSSQGSSNSRAFNSTTEATNPMDENEINDIKAAAKQEGIDEAAKTSAEAQSNAVKEAQDRFFSVMESDTVKEGRSELAMEWLKSESMALVSADEMIEMLAKTPVASAPAQEQEEELGEDARALMRHAENNAGTPKATNRGEGSGSESDGTGEHRNTNTGKDETSTYKSSSKLPAPREEYGANRGQMMDGFLSVAGQVKKSTLAKRAQC